LKGGFAKSLELWINKRIVLQAWLGCNYATRTSWA